MFGYQTPARRQKKVRAIQITPCLQRQRLLLPVSLNLKQPFFHRPPRLMPIAAGRMDWLRLLRPMAIYARRVKRHLFPVQAHGYGVAGG